VLEEEEISLATSEYKVCLSLEKNVDGYEARKQMRSLFVRA